MGVGHIRLASRIFLALVCFSAAVKGYAKGAPFSTCLTMFPKHGPNQKQTGDSSFLINLSPQTYTPGSLVTVELTSTNGSSFRGLQVKATRSTGDTESVVGSFVDTPANKTHVFTCEGGFENMVTHSNEDYVREVRLKWKAPKDNIGDITFIATVVVNYSTFYTGITSRLKAASSEGLVKPKNILPSVNSHPDKIDFDQCGSTKGCFFYPRYCSGSDCQAAATFREDGDHFRFELMAHNSTYVSIGFSDDTKMGNDETVICTAHDKVFSVQHGQNPGLFNLRMVRDQLSDLKVKLADGRLTCSFRRPRAAVTRAVNHSASVEQLITKPYDLYSEKYYLMLAWGTVKLGTDVINKHKELPPVTDHKVQLRELVIHRGSTLPAEYRLHASLMAVSWVMFAGLTTAMSRYFKPWLGKRLFCQSNIWFQVHRVTGILTGVFTLSSVILIFVVIGGFADKEKKHASVGLTVACIAVVQVLAGLLRPDKGADARPFFNWGHRILGQCAHILSAVAMYLAFDISYIPEVMQNFGVAVITGWVAVQIVWTIVFELRRCCVAERPASKDQLSWRQELTNVDTILLFCYFLTLLLSSSAILAAILVF